MADSGDGSSRRERKKEAMREALEKAALRLFSERGFSDTTVADITDDVDVARRTFFRYFDSKEAVLFAQAESTLQELRQALDDRPADEPIGKSVVAVLRLLAERQEDDRETTLVRTRISMSAPEVQARGLAIQHAWQATIAEWIRDRLGAEATDMRPDVLAGAAVGALGVALAHWVARGGIEDPVDLMDEAMQLLDEGFDPAMRPVD